MENSLHWMRHVSCQVLFIIPGPSPGLSVWPMQGKQITRFSTVAEMVFLATTLAFCEVAGPAARPQAQVGLSFKCLLPYPCNRANTISPAACLLPANLPDTALQVSSPHAAVPPANSDDAVVTPAPKLDPSAPDPDKTDKNDYFPSE